ncbi:MAG TPA: GNAT family N-acetyltransferase [Casimicrobiaceae bacterium]|nr:GNAT family N-acetyltransferase [Casimicrobiaceae bacterium]
MNFRSYRDMASNLPVSLREIDASTVRAILALTVAPDQQKFVANNAVSLAQALFSPEAWYRAIYLTDEPVGFVMLYDEALRVPPPEAPELFLWRFMIDARFQRRGIGSCALEQVISHARAKRNATSLGVSYVPGPGCPEPFYLASGFRHTGRVDDGEIVLELDLAPESR